MAARRKDLTVRPEMSMSRDTLSDVLRAVRLRGAVFYYIEGASPWVAEAPAAREIIPAIMPGVDHMIEFHGAGRGGVLGRDRGRVPGPARRRRSRPLPPGARARDVERAGNAG